MQDAQYYWDLFLETGAPEAYVRYRAAVTNTEQAQLTEYRINNQSHT